MTKETEDKGIDTVTTFELVEFSADPITINKEGTQVIPWKVFITEDEPEDGAEEGLLRFTLYLYDELYDVSHYSKLFALLRRLHYYNSLDVHINCPGGDMSTLMAFANVFEDCSAYITMILDGFAESAAAIMAFMGDALVIHDHIVLMFHNIQLSGLISEDGSKLRMSMDVLSRVYEHMLDTYCSNILSKDQIRAIIDSGAEIRFTGPELMEVLSKTDEFGVQTGRVRAAWPPKDGVHCEEGCKCHHCSEETPKPKKTRKSKKVDK